MPGRQVLPAIAFTPPNRGPIRTNLDLTKAQLAKLCDATTRQIGHWANGGYLIVVRQDPERFNGDAPGA